jgi:OOP family OmpA-OmpF porin
VTRSSILAAIGAAAWVGAASADYLSLGLSYVSPDDGRGSAHGAGGSAGYGRSFTERWAAEARVFAHTLKPDDSGDQQPGQAGAGLDLLFAPEGSSGFVLLAGVGAMRTGPDAVEGTGAFGNIGLGWRDRVPGSALRYRVELRGLADQSGPGYTDALLSFVIELPPAALVPAPAAAAPLRVVTLERPAPVVIADADADGIADESDRCASTLRGARVEPDGCVWQEQVVTLSNLLFPSSSDRLTADIRTRLDEVVRFFANQPDVRMDIFGHTDASGPESLNLKLSKGRAAAVRDYLVKKGIAAQRLTSDGFGETRPIASNETVEGKSANRRVDLHIHARQPV